jgi:hypothetical protein
MNNSRRLMIKRCWPALGLLSMYSVLAGGSSSAPISAVPAASQAAHRSASKYPAWRAAAAQNLIARGDASSLATAAALTFAGASGGTKADAGTAKSDAVELAAKASELDPQNPTIGWLRLELCAGTSGCDIRDAATAVRWVDADNGAVWLPTLSAALKERDSTETDRILQDMAEGSRFDLYRNRTVVLLFDTLKRAGKALPASYVPSDLARLSEAVAITDAEIMPSFAPLLAACREPAVPERRENCLRLGKTMQRGDTVAAQMAGFAIERHLSAPDSKEARAVAERRRVLEYRVSTASEHDAPALPWQGNAHARGRVAQMRATPREEDVDIAILRERRMPLEPPEDYR